MTLAAVVLLAAAAGLLGSCAPSGPPSSGPPSSGPRIAIAKWFDNHAAAISITYDGWPDPMAPVDDLAADLGLMLDYQLVTQRYVKRDDLPDWVEHDLTDLIPHAVPGVVLDHVADHPSALLPPGFSYFGHGHWHVDHDTLTYAQAYESFRLCFEFMERMGLKPVAYAYPRGGGTKTEVQRALADAGFLAGRLGEGAFPYIVPDAETAPQNWYGLPTVVMESYDFQQCDGCINDTAELTPILDTALERTAWIIPMYHSIGRSGWGFYRFEDFRRDMQAVADRDFWAASMNDVALYIRERETAAAAMDTTEQDGVTTAIRVTLSDGLDNDRFDQPLTLIFTPPADWRGRPVRVTQNGRLVDWVFPDTETVLVSLPPDEEPYVLEPFHDPHSGAGAKPAGE